MYVLRTLNKCLWRESSTVYILVGDLLVKQQSNYTNVQSNKILIQVIDKVYKMYIKFIFHFRNLEELSKSVFRHKFHKNVFVLFCSGLYGFFFFWFLVLFCFLFVCLFFLGGGGGGGGFKLSTRWAGGVRVLVAEATKCSRFYLQPL